MPSSAVTVLLEDGRLHLQHGPIDILVNAVGDPGDIVRAYADMSDRFITILDELVMELDELRRDSREGFEGIGTVARRMTNAVSGLSGEFLTPMAAVAGSIAEEVVVAGWGARGLHRLWANNGGDIAFRIADGETVSIGVVADVNAPSIVGRLVIDASSPVRGVATSGWGGRSWSLGIADAVTILARQASIADAAATVVANTVDLPGHPAVRRAPARSLDDNSDLGDLLVTTGVGDLSPHEVRVALDAGESEVMRLVAAGVIEGAVLCLKGSVRLLGAATPMTGESARSDAPRK